MQIDYTPKKDGTVYPVRSKPRSKLPVNCAQWFKIRLPVVRHLEIYWVQNLLISMNKFYGSAIRSKAKSTSWDRRQASGRKGSFAPLPCSDALVNS